MKFFFSAILACTFLTASSTSNQTDTLSPVHSENGIPFSLKIEQADFMLPSGVQDYAAAIYDGKWLILAGRNNGLHGFSTGSFPPSRQNTLVFVVDPSTGTTWTRSLKDPTSLLSQDEIDSLSVTSAEAFQNGYNASTLYLVGGYGINTGTGKMETKKTLTAIDIQSMMDWVITGRPSAKSAIRQISNPILQVTGGALFQANPHQPMLLILGQNFDGVYTDSSNGLYTHQIRPFWLNDNGKHLSIIPQPSLEKFPDYRRRDLNVFPILHKGHIAFVALSGVFTLESGVWTVPILIHPDGSSKEPNPKDPKTFKQAMNQYICSNFTLYSESSGDTYAVLPGGLSYGYFDNGTFETDPEIPFINQVTTIKIDKNLNFTQHLMKGEYPVIPSTGTNPGNPLLFGTSAQFFPASYLPLVNNEIISLDGLPGFPTVIGYIVGGIMSTLPNTTSSSDSTASPYVFKVTLVPKT